MAGCILDGEAKLATALIQVKRAGLENRLLFAPIKIAERNEIVQQLEKVAMITDQTVHGGDRIGFRLEGFIFGNERGEGFRGFYFREFRESAAIQAFQRCVPALLAAQPS